MAQRSRKGSHLSGCVLLGGEYPCRLWRHAEGCAEGHQFDLRAKEQGRKKQIVQVKVCRLAWSGPLAAARVAFCSRHARELMMLHWYSLRHFNRIFSFESNGIKTWIKSIKVKCLEWVSWGALACTGAPGWSCAHQCRRHAGPWPGHTAGSTGSCAAGATNLISFQKHLRKQSKTVKTCENSYVLICFKAFFILNSLLVMTDIAFAGPCPVLWHFATQPGPLWAIHRGSHPRGVAGRRPVADGGVLPQKAGASDHWWGCRDQN